MTEGIRRTGGREAQHLPSVRPGIEGFAVGMRIFPRLKEWENQIALRALREGKTVDDLRGITPFRQHLKGAKRAMEAGKDDPFIPFANLFDASPSIDMLISFGNFHTIRTWTWTFAQQYPNLNLPLEQFFQNALYTIAPAQAKAYDPSFGKSYTSFLVDMLKLRFVSFVNVHKRDHTTPISYEEKDSTKKGRATASRERVWFASLETPTGKGEDNQTFLDYVETTQTAPEDTSLIDDQEAIERIHTLSTLAQLNHIQEETLIALFVYGGDTKLLSQLRRSTARSVRMQRQTALEKIRELGYETVNDILSGSNPPQRR